MYTLQLEAALVPVVAYGISMVLLALAPSNSLPIGYTIAIMATMLWISYQAQTYGKIGPILGWSWEGKPGSAWNWATALPSGLIIFPPLASGFVGGQKDAGGMWAKYPLAMPALRAGGWLAMAASVSLATMGGTSMDGWKYRL